MHTQETGSQKHQRKKGQGDNEVLKTLRPGAYPMGDRGPFPKTVKIPVANNGVVKCLA